RGSRRAARPVPRVSAGLSAANHPARFWRPMRAPERDAAQWDAAIRRAAPVLPYLARAGDDGIERLLEATLGEGQFGDCHWRLKPARRGFYLLKPLLPPALGVPCRAPRHPRAPPAFPPGQPP